MKQRLQCLLPILRVHSWGGYGSQLHSAYIVLRIQSRFPGRRIRVIIHTSGVTRRKAEFNFDALRVKSVQRDDYRESNINTLSTNRNLASLYLRTRALKGFLLSLLETSKLLQYSNDEKSFNAIKPWTIALRGHYTKLALVPATVESFYEFLFRNNVPDDSKSLVIHYRLGDLLYIKDKGPIDITRVEQIAQKIPVGPNVPLLLSDSVGDELTNFLRQSKVLSKCEFANYDPLATLNTCIDSENFIGSNAKLSLWAAIFRYHVFQKESFLPRELDWSIKLGLKSNWY